MTKKNLDFIFKVLKDNFYSVETELNYSTPFQLMMAVILSAQTTDKQVNKVTSTFFDNILGPCDVLDIGLGEFTKLIQSVNYYRNKAKYIYKTSELMCDNVGDELKNDVKNNVSSMSITTPEEVKRVYGYHIDSDRRKLMTYPGIGEKTAKVIVHVLYNIPVIAVDTHVHRVVNRLGIVNTRTPLETSKLLEKVIDDKYKVIAHHSLIYFGRYRCTAKHPKCDKCLLKGVCKFVK